MWHLPATIVAGCSLVTPRVGGRWLLIVSGNQACLSSRPHGNPVREEGTIKSRTAADVRVRKVSAVIDLDNATKGAIAFSSITIWGGVKGKRLPRHGRACLAWLATQACSRPQVPKEVRDGQARPEYRWLTDPGRE
jgi:hypothetical protein